MIHNLIDTRPDSLDVCIWLRHIECLLCHSTYVSVKCRRSIETGYFLCEKHVVNKAVRITLVRERLWRHNNLCNFRHLLSLPENLFHNHLSMFLLFNKVWFYNGLHRVQVQCIVCLYLTSVPATWLTVWYTCIAINTTNTICPNTKMVPRSNEIAIYRPYRKYASTLTKQSPCKEA